MQKKMSSVSILKHAQKVTPNYLVSSPWTPRLLPHFLSDLFEYLYVRQCIHYYYEMLQYTHACMNSVNGKAKQCTLRRDGVRASTV